MTRKRISLLFLMLLTVFILAIPASAAPKLNKKSVTLVSGEPAQLFVTGTAKKVRWSSSDKTVAKVNKNGVVRAVKSGSAVITAKVGAKKLTCKVRVKKSAIQTGTNKVVLTKGQTKTVNVDINGYGAINLMSDNREVIKCKLGAWKNTSIPVTITGLARGNATITLTTNLSSGKSVINVTVK